MSTRAKASTSKESANATNAGLTPEQLRRKAKFQLMGSAVLVAVGVVLFAVLLDSPPRPNTDEVSILIPARDSLAPLAMPGTAANPTNPASALAPAAPASSAAAVSVAAASAAAPMPVATAAKTASSAKTTASAPASATTAPVAPTAPAKVAAPAPVTPAVAASTAATGTSRFVVQVGAFTDAQKIRDVRAKLERAGLKTYAQVVQTSEGQRTRVRVGPFATKAEAEKVAAKIKSLDLPAGLLEI